MKFAFVLVLLVTVTIEITDGSPVSNLFSDTQEALDSLIDFSLGPKFRGSSSSPKPSSKVFEAKIDVDRAMHQAQASSANQNFTLRRLNDLIQSIDWAVGNGSLNYARWALGTGLFGQFQLDKASRRKRRSTTPQVKFLKNIFAKLKHEKFHKLMSVNRDSTLMFAIDTTGSMHDEITAAKNIAMAIVNWPRNRSIEVDYVLSPFNDPDVGPVTFRDVDEGDQFVKDIGSLTASGGGDCKEPAYRGMVKGMTEPHDPMPNSPLFVFTDAPPKTEGEEQGLAIVKRVAEANRVSVTFFVARGCGPTEDYGSYHEIAEITGGYVFNLPSTSLFQQMNGLAALSLKDFAVLCSVKHDGTRRKRLATRSNAHTIIVDGPFENLIVGIESDRSRTIVLKDPGNNTIEATSSFSKGAVYLVPNPPPGHWKLLLSSSDGHYRYTVKALSEEKIDFAYDFILPVQRRITSKETLIPHPLSGRTAFVGFSVSGSRQVNKTSLVMRLVNTAGTTVLELNLAAGHSSFNYTASFTPPSTPFRFQLSGRVGKEGLVFQRETRDLIQAKSVVLRVISGKDDFRMKQGSTSFLVFKLFNVGPNEYFTIYISDTTGFIKLKLEKFVRRNRQRTILVSLRPTAKGYEKGKADEVIVTARGKVSKTEASALARMQME